MKPFGFYSWIVLVGFMTIGFLGTSPIHAQDADTEEGAAPVEFEPVVELVRDVHFLTPQSEDVVVPSGTYTVGASDGGLRLTLSDEAEEKAVIIKAEATTHERAIDSSHPLSIPGEEDQHLVMLLFPDGTALQAVGSYSGVRPRGFRLSPGFWKGLRLPTVKAIFTVPTLGAVTPGGTLYIKGKNFGVKGLKSKVFLHLRYPKKHKVSLSVKKWTNTKITAKIPGDISGVIDHKAKFQVLDAKGIGGVAWRVPFYATREGRKLAQNDPAVKVKHCSTGADKNYCNGVNASTGGSCFQTSVPNFKKWGSIYARHVNCDHIIDWDDGTDRYAITLKNKWVFTKVMMNSKKSSSSEKIYLPNYSALRKNLPGRSSWDRKIRWEVSPGPDQIEYVFEFWIEGPKGIPHY